MRLRSSIWRYVAPAAVAALVFALVPGAAGQFGGAQHVTVRADAPRSVKPGAQFELPVVLKITPGFHIQSNKPAPNYVPTVVRVSGPKGFEFGQPGFPAAEMAQAAGETIPVFSNTVTVRVPVRAPRDFAGQVRLTVKVSYQACDAGSCFPPTETSYEVPLTVSAEKPSPGSSKPSPSATPSGPPQAASAGSADTTGEGTSPRKSTPDSAASELRPPSSRPDASASRKAEPKPFEGYNLSKVTAYVGPEEFTRFLESGATGSSGGAGEVERLLEGGDLLLALPLIFLLGLALNLTPCVYPIIPITVSYFGSQVAGGGKKPIGLAVVYVLGMAIMYSALGVAAGLSGTLFGSQLQNPWVLLVFALIMFGLALSQFDRPDGRPIWEFQLPAFLRDRARTRSGVPGALLMGMMVGVVAAPCIGPAVIALLQWVGMKQSPFLGFAVFFSLALGLGLPYVFLAAASGSVRSLPRSGEWMVGVKHIFGSVLVWMGFYYLQTPLALLNPLLPKASIVIVTGGIAVYLLFIERSGAAVRWFTVLRRFTGIAALALAVWLAIPAPRERIHWQPYSDGRLQAALAERKPVIIDFTADWCAACREMEHTTFTDPRVGAAARGFVALRADMTNFGGGRARRWQAFYGIKGLPTVVRLMPK